MSIVAQTGPVSADAHSADRLDALDGLRAIAVTWVTLYHYLHFWTPAGRGDDLTAYGESFADLPLLSAGYLGVDLFFMVSGFVILLTLEKTRSFVEFLLKRAIRLWPPLLLFGTLTFVVVRLCGPEELQVSVAEYLLSIIILPPQHVALVAGQEGWQWLDGAYWSLWVEVKFYVLIGLLYFLRPSRIIALWSLFELATIGLFFADLTNGSAAIAMANGFFFQPFVPYFSFGIAAYMASTGRLNMQVRLLALIALTHLMLLLGRQLYLNLGTELEAYVLQGALANIGIFAAFYAIVWRGARLSLLETPFVTRMGRASYGVYLMHQNIGLVILSLPLFATTFSGLIGVTMTFALIVMIAITSYEMLERPLQSYLRQQLRRFSI